MTVKTHYPVRHSEIDSLGIVHHSIYPLWFETGRAEFLEKAGFPNSALKAHGLFLPLTDLFCSYKAPAKYGDEIVLAISLIYMSYVKIKFEYRVINRSTEKVMATGITVHAWTNKKLEPINIEKSAPMVYGKLLQLVEHP